MIGPRAAIPLLVMLAQVSFAATDGHEKMVELLGNGEFMAIDKNHYQGEGEARRLRSELASLADRAPAHKRVELNFHLGIAEGFLGNERDAIKHLSEAVRLLADVRGAPRDFSNQVRFRLAVAYLRLGETENCCLRYTPESCVLPIQGEGVHTLQESSLAAIEQLEQILKDVATSSKIHFQARWLLNIAYMTVGRWPQGLPDDLVVSPEALRSEEPFPRFTNIAPQLGLNTFSLSGGVVADDFDNDDDIDLLVSTSDISGQTRLFINGGDGTFSEQTKAAGLAGITGGLNLVQADYDNDGDVDVLVLRGGWFEEAGQHPNSLLRNDGEGHFVDVTFEAGLGEEHYPTQTGGWADYDNDGDLDIYIGNESTYAQISPCQLFHNNGNGTFTDVAPQAGVVNDAFAKSIIWGDYDGDGFADLYVSNLGAPNRLYHNNGDGTFTDMAPRLGVAMPKQSFPAWFWDFDNDGNLDLMVWSYAAGIAEVAASYLNRPFRAEMSRLYRGDGEGGFTDVADSRNLKRPTKPMGVNFGDIDNDGYLDFYLGTGDTDYTQLMPNLFYVSRDRGERFSDVTEVSGFGNLQKGHGIAFADFDNDGDQDLFAQMGGAYKGDAFGDSFYENPGFGNRWLTVRLVGVRSNRSAIGARIRVDVANADGSRHTYYKHVNSGSSFGANPLRQTLGLGRAERIEELQILWPATSTTQVFHDVPLDSFVSIVEGEQSLEVRTLPTFSFSAN